LYRFEVITDYCSNLIKWSLCVSKPIVAIVIHFCNQADIGVSPATDVVQNFLVKALITE